MVSAQQREYAEAFACRRITKNTDTVTDLQTTGLLEKILHKDNLNKAYKKGQYELASIVVPDSKCALRSQLAIQIRAHPLL